MFETVSLLPTSFWLALLLLLGGGAWAITMIREGIGLPILAVLGTVLVWYVGDMYYNDYASNHAILFDASTLENAWTQVAWFLASFVVLTPLIHGWINKRLKSRPSQVLRLIKSGGEKRQFQARLTRLFWGTATTWAVLSAIAIMRLGSETPYYFFPFLGERIDPWARAQVGGGFSALLSLAGYLQLFLAAMFGLVAALTRNPQVRSLALLGCALAWPYYIFDRTRNSILVIIIPGLLCWVFVRLRSSLVSKVAVLVICFMAINAWFSFIISNRSNISITAAFRGEGAGLKEAAKNARHEGLNMFEELCWSNHLIKTNQYSPNWGSNYFANLVNPIPRGLWPGKPTIGLDYALARGQQGYSDLGVSATIATGLIGQGVVNFGAVIGPAFAALLMSMWAALLARFDLLGNQVGYLGLYLLGLVETFNLGRDITLIAMYPVIFGFLIFWLSGRITSKPNPAPKKTRHETR